MRKKIRSFFSILWLLVLWEWAGRPPDFPGDLDMVFCCAMCKRIVHGWDEGGTDDEFCDECWTEANRE